MSYRNVQYLIGNLFVSIFWQIYQKYEIRTSKAAVAKSTCALFFASPFTTTIFAGKFNLINLVISKF